MNSKLIIKKQHMTDEIIKEIMNIDKVFYNEDLSLSYYKERYSKENISYCLYDKENIVGYITKYGIKESLYKDLKNGLYDNDYKLDIELLDDNSNYIYISSIIILDKYRNQGYGLKLLNKVLNEKNKNYIAMSISKAGFNLLNNKMELVKKVTDKVFVFELNNIKKEF